MDKSMKKEVKKVIRQLCHDHYDYKTGTVSTPKNGVEKVFHAESYKRIDQKVLIINAPHTPSIEFWAGSGAL